jgi:lactoylglutathione lyase
MFSHIMVGVSDFNRAMAFYTPVLQALGVQFRFLEEDRPWAGWQSSPDPRPLFLIGRPHNQAPHHPGNGQMVAFLAASRADVDRVHALALAHTAAPVKARPAYGPSTTRITTARISAIRMGTSCVWFVMG